MKVLVTFSFILILNSGYSQVDTLNQVNSKGSKIGYWEIYYPGEDSTLFGKGYYNIVKTGEWNYYYQNGQLKSKFNYKIDPQRKWKSQKHGEYEKYYPNGCLMEKGSLGTCVITSGMERKEVICNEGKVTMYYKDPCNVLAYSRMFDSGEQVWIIKYDRSGSPSDTIFTENYFRHLNSVIWTYGKIPSQWNDDTSAVERREIIKHADEVMVEDLVDNGAIKYTGGVSRNGEKLKLNGYNKVYKTDGNLWLDGVFKHGYLYDGLRYLYSDDGILLKIEIWKNGKYHSDRPLQH